MTKPFLFHPFFSAGNLSCDWLCWPLQKKWWQRNLESTENWVNVAAKRSTVTAATDSWWLCSRLRFLLLVAGNGCQMADRKSSRISGCLWGHPGDISTKCGHFQRISWRQNQLFFTKSRATSVCDRSDVFWSPTKCVNRSRSQAQCCDERELTPLPVSPIGSFFWGERDK